MFDWMRRKSKCHLPALWWCTTNLEDVSCCCGIACSTIGNVPVFFRRDAMDIQVESRGDRRIVRIRDKITFEYCPVLQARLDSVLDDNVREVVLDFKDVPFMDSSGIGEVLRLFKLLRDKDGELVLINPNSKLRGLFDMYRFRKFMRIRDAVEPGQE